MHHRKTEVERNSSEGYLSPIWSYMFLIKFSRSPWFFERRIFALKEKQKQEHI